MKFHKNYYYINHSEGVLSCIQAVETEEVPDKIEEWEADRDAVWAEGKAAEGRDPVGRDPAGIAYAQNAVNLSLIKEAYPAVK
ncbi:hypothetical protein ISS30_02950 [bacterium]|nr:hypothetical protein [bacterium]